MWDCNRHSESPTYLARRRKPAPTGSSLIRAVFVVPQTILDFRAEVFQPLLHVLGRQVDLGLLLSQPLLECLLLTHQVRGERFPRGKKLVQQRRLGLCETGRLCPDVELIQPLLGPTRVAAPAHCRQPPLLRGSALTTQLRYQAERLASARHAESLLRTQYVSHRATKARAKAKAEPRAKENAKARDGAKANAKAKAKAES